ncbi:heavy metal translocating P-type ATPase [Dendrosporobacter sp. 1207_IL3150]|uniref:heavy metal translocating P-type ATPase n=1 Tax=Dendrosporobacter sp. 1207_IL3150 TaxID=3084054 RepID=UPI002FDACCFF
MSLKVVESKLTESKSHGHHHDHGHGYEYIVVGLSTCLVSLYWFEIMPAIFGIDTALIAALLCGFPIVREAIMAIVKQGDTKVGLLVSIAIIASIAIGEYFAAAEVAIIMTIGEMLEHKTLEKSNDALQKLAELAPLKARIISSGEEKEIPAEAVRQGDYLLVKPGEKIPVDGNITRGFAVVDQSAITGESIPVEKTVGELVFGGTIIERGSIEITAVRVGKDTALGHIIQMVEQAQQSKAPIARIIDKWADWFVPLSLGIAVLVYAVTGDIVRAVTILIVFCPCAMLLSTPTAVAAAIGMAARRGVLVKGGEVLEQIGDIDTILFDKTGTVTVGQPKLADIACYGDWKRPDVLSIAAGIEKRSEHHLAKAIIDAAVSEKVVSSEPEEWQQLVGLGVTAKVGYINYLLGNKSLLDNNGIMLLDEQIQYSLERQLQGETVVYLATESDLAAIITIVDPLRSGAAEAIESLKQAGIKTVALITGDAAIVGKAVGEKLNISEVHGDLLPGDKVQFVKSYQEQGNKVLMVGDGVNDAPALAAANVGVAMGSGGTNVALEAASIALLSGDLKKLKVIIQLSRRTIKTIHQNIIAANFINFAAIVLAAYGLLGPVAAAIVHNLGAILVVLNSSRLLRNSE